MLVLLTACGDSNLTADEYIQRAQELRLEGDFQAAVLELKNALQQEPDNPSARFMLGEVYLRTGDGTSAEKEFERAVEAGMNQAAVRMPLARAWLLQNSYQELLDKLAVPEKGQSGRATVLAMRGRAYLGLGRIAEAEAAFNESLDSDDQSVDALVGLARVALANQDTETARTYLEKAEGVDGDALEVIRLRGDLAFQTEDFEKAEAAYTTLRERRPQYLVYRLALASAQIGQEKYDAAIENLDTIRKAVPDHPQVNYLRGLAAYRTNNYEDAKYYMDQVLAQEPNSAPALLIAGGASFAMDQLEQARRHLERFTGMAPGYAPGLKLLAATQMRMGENDAAMATLRPLTDSPEDIEDQELLRMVATAALQSGDLESGRNYIEQAARQSPDDAGLRAQLGMTRINMGELEEGLKDLESAVEEDPGFSRARVALGFNQLRSGRLEEALATARELQESLPDNSVGHVLEGMVHDRRDDEEAAQANFRKALEINPGAADAAHNLATIAVRNDALDEARQIYEDFLDDNPDNVLTLVQLAQLEARLNNPEKLEEYLSRVVELRPDAAAPRVFLGRFYLVRNRPQEAVQVLEEVLQDNPDNAGLLEVLGRAQLALGRAGDAVGTFARLTDAAPESAAAHYWLANARLEAGNVAAAQSAVDEALSIAPENARAQFLKGDIAARMGDPEAVKAVLDKLGSNEDIQSTPQYQDLAASLALLENRPQEAIAQLEAANETAPSNRRTARLAMVEARSGDVEAAIRRLNAWLDDHPEDGTVRLQLSGIYSSLERYADAQAVLETMVEQYPKSWPAHNDLAWVLYEQDKLEPAREHARTAIDLAPDQPLVLDTYGTVLLASGEPKSAIVPLERAVNAMENATATRLTLAKAYQAAGRRDEAVRTLESLLDTGGDFAARDEAQTLLSQWRAAAE